MYISFKALETVVSCNDGNVRYLDVPSLQQTVCFNFDWPVNCAEQSPDSQLVAVVGDAVETVLERLAGHRDYGFAVRWSPDGRHLATASQDRTVQIYDCRNRSRPLCVLKTCLASVRSLRYTSDSKLLLMAESGMISWYHIIHVCVCVCNNCL
jgi:WD40 repeat protein